MSKFVVQRVQKRPTLAQLADMKRAEKVLREQAFIDEIKNDPDALIWPLARKYHLDPHRVLRKYGMDRRFNATPEERAARQAAFIAEYKADPTANLWALARKYRVRPYELLAEHGIYPPKRPHNRKAK